NSTNSTKAGQLIEHRILWTDTYGLSGYIFSFDNGTGTFVNDSFVSMTGTSNWSNITKSVNSTVGLAIRWKIYANDSVNNSNATVIFVYDTTLANEAPTIPVVQSISATDPTIGTTTAITFNFTANDNNGADDINASSAQAQFLMNGETTRSNTSCTSWASAGNNVNFTCTIDMWYFDQNGAWTVNVSVKDNLEEYAENSSTTFTYNIMTAMVMSPSSVNWPTINLLDTDTGSSDDPITINNSGNDINLNINITAYNLRGVTTPTEFIYANNFTIQNASQGCSGTAMVNQTSTNVTSAILQRGNNTLNYYNETSGQEQIYFCLKGVPHDISSQSYSSSAYGSWEIRILLVALIPRKKKKEKVEKDNLFRALNLILDEIKEEYSLNKKEMIEILTDKLRNKYQIGKKEIFEIIREKEIRIPVSIFSKELGALESLTKYMKENLNMSYKQIADEISRDERTIWTSYKKAQGKHKEKLEIKKTEGYIPMSAFENKKLTILESVIIYLKNKKFKFSEIAKMLKRDQRNIWTVYSRAKGKKKQD
ncbi:MAG: hypothetical protein NTW17_03285, partial [Candidatus Pacearchaeota archaeon]|nr:hypothetical protein [Candidatus Pacearchaeota archaeon]